MKRRASKRVLYGMKYLPIVLVVTSASLFANACGVKSDGPTAPPAASAQALSGFQIAERQQCFSCHQVQGKGGRSGPALDSSSITVKLSGGQTVNRDKAYLRKSITDPDAEVVQGYPKGVMSAALSSRAKLSDQQVSDLVAYLVAAQKK